MTYRDHSGLLSSLWVDGSPKVLSDGSDASWQLLILSETQRGRVLYAEVLRRDFQGYDASRGILHLIRVSTYFEGDLQTNSA